MSIKVGRTAPLAAAVLAVAVGVGPAAAQQQLSIVGSGPGAGAYQMAAAMAENVNRLNLGITITNRASKGFVANTRMLETGGVDIGLTNGIFVHSAQTGGNPFEEMKSKNLRGIGPVTTSWWQVAVLKKSGITKYEDLKGKRVNYAQKGSNTEFMARFSFEALGLQDSIQKEYLRWDQGATAMTDGNIDAITIPNPVPAPSILQAAASAPVRILPMPEKVVEAFIKHNPGYYRATVPPGSYPGMENEGFDTIAYTIISVAKASVPDDVVYKVTKATYDDANREFITTAFKSWRIGLDAAKNDAFLKQMAGYNLKLHPGAERYWKERGLIK